MGPRCLSACLRVGDSDGWCPSWGCSVGKLTVAPRTRQRGQQTVHCSRCLELCGLPQDLSKWLLGHCPVLFQAAAESGRPALPLPLVFVAYI